MGKKDHKRPAATETPLGGKVAGIALGAQPEGRKTPAIAQEPESYLPRKMAWRLGRIHLVEPFGWSGLDHAGLLAIHQKLAMFESMTFGEVFGRDKKRNHQIDVEAIPNREAKRCIEKHLPGQTALWTLRLSGAERIWGILGDGAFHVIFWDPKHLIFPCSK